MSKKKTKKIMGLLISVIMIISTFQSIVFAAEAQISTSIGTILNAIAWAGYVISFGMLMYIGAKYALSAANEKADVKRGAVAYVIGAILIAGASTIAALFVGVAAGGTEDRGSLAQQIVDAGHI